MNLFFRLFILFLTYRFKSQVNLLDEVETKLTALPSDIDLNIHINNGVYLSMMDLGRFDLIFRSGLVSILKKHRIYPLVASQTIRYVRSINLFEKFSIKTKAIGWDDRFFYLSQNFYVDDNISALGVVKIRFKSTKSGGITPADFAKICQIDPVSPPVPAYIAQWVDSEDLSWRCLNS